jgi:hypothetical protein
MTLLEGSSGGRIPHRAEVAGTLGVRIWANLKEQMHDTTTRET